MRKQWDISKSFDCYINFELTVYKCVPSLGFVIFKEIAEDSIYIWFNAPDYFFKKHVHFFEFNKPTVGSIYSDNWYISLALFSFSNKLFQKDI